MAQKIVHASKTVTTAGTRVQLSTTAPPTPSLFIQANKTNTGRIYVGLSTVASTDCICSLEPGDSITIEGEETRNTQEYVFVTDYWIDSSVSGEKAFFSYTARR